MWKGGVLAIVKTHASFGGIFLFLFMGSMTSVFGNSGPLPTDFNSSSVVYASGGKNSRESSLPSMETELPIALPQLSLPPLRDTSNQRFQHLPLESLFPHLKSKIYEKKNPEGINLTSALLNHSLHHGSDDELDRIVFSSLPEGSKLVLKTVKIIRTDEHGNEKPMGDPAISLNVLPIGMYLDDDSYEDVSDEVEQGSDLTPDASSNSEDYNAYYAANKKEKEKEENYHNGKDYGQDHDRTLTDTEGKKVTNYKGREKGLTDFDHAHGKAESKDGERFKNSKKKNRGRKVTGFKRIYHKEEFQRTEHFYDDEEAKKIAESFGIAASKSKKEHGKKDDERKYHGGRVELTDGEKVKNEHSTHRGHHKGHNVAHKNADNYRHSQHHSSHRYTPSYRPRNPYHNQPRHPNHRYNAEYSDAHPKYDPSPASAQESVVHTEGENSQILYTPSLLNSHGQDDVEEVEPNHHLLDENKIFRVPTNRFNSDQSRYYYAPNFGPAPPSTTEIYYLGSSLSQDLGDGTSLPKMYFFHRNFTGNVVATTPRMKLNGDTRYAGTYPSPRPTSPYPSPPPIYSTVIKMKTRNYPQIPYYVKPIPENIEPNLISIDKALGTKVEMGSTPARDPRARGAFFNTGYANWNPIQSGTEVKNQNHNLTVLATFPALKPNISSLSPSLHPHDPTLRVKNDSRSNHGSFPKFSQVLDSGNFSNDPLIPPAPFLPRRPRPYIRFKSNGEELLPSQPRPHPNLPVSSNFYYGHSLTQEEPIDDGSNSYAPSPHFTRRGTHSLSNFMNGLMSSVSGFFNRIGLSRIQVK